MKERGYRGFYMTYDATQTKSVISSRVPYTANNM